MPRAFSSGKRSVSTPVRAAISAVLPWSMWPAVPSVNGRAGELIRTRRLLVTQTCPAGGRRPAAVKYGAAKESNLPAGERRLPGFEDPSGHRPRATPGFELRRDARLLGAPPGGPALPRQPSTPSVKCFPVALSRRMSLAHAAPSAELVFRKAVE